MAKELKSWHHTAWLSRPGDQAATLQVEGDPNCRFAGSHEGTCLPREGDRLTARVAHLQGVDRGGDGSVSGSHKQYWEPDPGPRQSFGINGVADCVRFIEEGAQGHPGGCFTSAEVCQVDNCVTSDIAHLYTGQCLNRNLAGGLASAPQVSRDYDGTVTVSGVGPDTRIVFNENGAGQSDIPYSFHTMPTEAMLSLAQLQTQGDQRYGEFNWRGISIREHVNHAITHLFAYLAGDEQDDHLQHGAWRALAALEGKLHNKEGK